MTQTLSPGVNRYLDVLQDIADWTGDPFGALGTHGPAVESFVYADVEEASGTAAKTWVLPREFAREGLVSVVDQNLDIDGAELAVAIDELYDKILVELCKAEQGLQVRGDDLEQLYADLDERNEQELQVTLGRLDRVFPIERGEALRAIREARELLDADTSS